MLLKTITVTALLAALHASALPSPLPATPSLAAADDASLVLTDTRFLDDGGILTIYSAHPASSSSNTTTTSDSHLARRCGSNTVHCDGKHVPAFNTCTALVDRIRTSGAVLNASPRALCLNRSGKDCCISWGSDVGAVHESDLWSAAKATLDRCVPENNSGRATDVSINGRCIAQCLSDRASGCRT
ncbi:hypothetical protein NEMBOFW57_000064 [Staphylotrichum longicolle]|uniref:WD-like domain-containing protein n=1 Tax=Staphylotrichum longicolle TaxID=669026 RepID=A0AAD4HZH6_9PEZI|nr:hypothetical protein NEMBOFW57_000064 [Staphylotrichum longicolle]